MSKEAVKEFYKVLQSDEALQQNVKAADSSMKVINIAAEKGYDFTELELEAFMQEAIAADGELSEEALETVAGGGDKKKDKKKSPTVDVPIDVNLRNAVEGEEFLPL